jgi:hypothetical protein
MKTLKSRRKELMNRFDNLLETGNPLAYQVLNELIRFLTRCKKLQSWYGKNRVELRGETILLDGRVVLRSKLPTIYKAHGIDLPKARSRTSGRKTLNGRNAKRRRENDC